MESLPSSCQRGSAFIQSDTCLLERVGSFPAPPWREEPDLNKLLKTMLDTY